jgi:hypothetical protein
MRLDERSAVGADEVEGSVVGEAEVVTEAFSSRNRIR